MRLCYPRTLAAAIMLAALSLLPTIAMAADTGACPRPDSGTEVLPPPDLTSSHGALNVALEYHTAVDFADRTLFCFTTADGRESPTLHVNPGDTVTIALTNQLKSSPGALPTERVSNAQNVCGDSKMKPTSANMHFHGLNVSPKCHGDEVIRTLINSGQTFTYKIKIPKDEPPGLYWYHPHVHFIASPAVQGGATGAIIVEGIENIQPAVAGLPQRLLVLRDQPLLISREQRGNAPQPFWDVSVNYVAVPWPAYPAPIIRMQRGTSEFWRVANAAANTIMDIEVDYDGKPQTLQVVGLDGVPTGSQDGKRQGTIVNEKHILLPPASRVEFILAAPAQTKTKAELITRTIDGGPASDSNPERRMARIVTTDTPVKLPRLPERSRPPHPQRFEDAANLKPTAQRKLYFYETSFPGRRPKTRPELGLFYIVVNGRKPVPYDPNNGPDIVTHQGAIEDWTIENHTTEVHEFHIHQIHFLVEEVNGKPVPKEERQWRDTYQVPYWPLQGPYPSIKVRMDFRGAVVGDFVYHCHILDHEDLGMMAIIRVKRSGT
jgi:FtsP/CotA-like multicopper oxidase with cupredoxin domain